MAGTPLEGAFLSDAGFMVDTQAYVSALIHDVGRAGGEVRLGESVLDVTSSATGVQVRTSTGSVSADRLVVAAGAWSGVIGTLAPLPVKPIRGQMITLFHPRARPNRILSGPTYLAPWRAGEIVVGATEEDAGFSAECTVAGLLQLMAGAVRVAPMLRDAAVRQSWAGLRSVTPNGHPLIGAYPSMERVLVATGHAGQGILSGAATGAAIVDIMNRGQSAVAEAFAPDRVIARIAAGPRAAG